MKRILSVFLALAFLFSFGLAVPAAANNANALSDWTCPNAPEPDDGWTCPNTPEPDDPWTCPNTLPDEPWECPYRPGPCPVDPEADECDCPVFNPYECPDCIAFWCVSRNRWIVTYICEDCRDQFPNAFDCWECFDAGCVECRDCPYCLDEGCDECRDLFWWEWFRVSVQNTLYYVFFGWLFGFGTPHADGLGSWLMTTWVGTAWQSFLGLFNRGGDDPADCDECEEDCSCDADDCCDPPYDNGDDCEDCTEAYECAAYPGCGGTAGGCLECKDEYICSECDE